MIRNSFKYDIGQSVLCEKFDSQYYAYVGVISDRVVCESNGENIYQVEFDIAGLKRLEYFFESNLIEFKPDTQSISTDIFDGLGDNFEYHLSEEDIKEYPIAINTEGTIQLTADRFESNYSDIENKVQDLEKKQKKISNLSKLAFLSRLL